MIGNYFRMIRKEIIDKIPENAKRILDVGCGEGAIGKEVKKRQDCKYVGIERYRKPAEIASKNLDSVITGDVGRLDLGKYKGYFDAVVLGDVLEHLGNPWGVLEKVTDTLRSGGHAIVSIPNMLSGSVQWELSKGLFRYQPAGVRDIHHLRFYTLGTITQDLVRVGLKIKHIENRPEIKNPEQYIISCKKLEHYKEKNVISIVILNWNTKDELGRCVESIRDCGTIPHEMIVVDQGSEDGSREWLMGKDDIKHIQLAKNCGFAAGNNIGVDVAGGDYVVLLNSDVIVSEGWLEGLREGMEEDKFVGGIGPATNYCGGGQMVKDAKYNGRKEFKTYAKERRKRFGNTTRVKQYLSFFCIMLKRKAMKETGTLDERFGLGNFEDNDYCLRLRKNPWGLRYMPGVFIHHEGSKAFRKNEVDYVNLMKNNKALMKEKWDRK